MGKKSVQGKITDVLLLTEYRKQLVKSNAIT
jgi:hypothetical protein